ncbi:ATP-dependent RecD-like DNA helicase [Thermodesulfobacteriota bacterium]
MKTENPQIELEGQIERITYFNEDTGFTVAKLNVFGYCSPVTVVGNIISPTPGEILSIKGSWTNHPKFGRQLTVESHSIKIPATISGIKKYLGSGLIRGIGPVMASRIVKEFGKKTLDIIENRIEKLQEIEGIGPKRVEMIQEAWLEQKEVRDVMIFLQSHGVGSGYAAKIFKWYGHGSLTVLTKNPYRLATDIHGIGFNTADKIAEKLGFDRNAPARAEAGVLYIMNQLADEGHVFYPYEELVQKCMDILEVERDIIVNAFGSLVYENELIIEDINDDLDRFEPNKKAVYLVRFHVSETKIAKNLSLIMHSKKSIRDMDKDKAVQWVQTSINLKFAQKQMEAIKSAISNKVMVVTGGPGTGKTTLINAVIKIYKEIGARILLAAPTGRASKRMSESAGFPARTIHRMLEYSMQKGGFQRNQENPLKVDVLILDEVSMIDTILMHHLLKAIPTKATLILVGDVNQLPSVGAGNVLKDIIKSSQIPVVELNEIFRQEKESLIIVNAHKVNTGIIPDLEPVGKELEDFYFIEQDDPEQVLAIILEMVCRRVPSRFNLDPVDDIQVLAPMHKGVVGTENLNRELQKNMNPSNMELTRGDRQFRLNDKVMQIRNNYDKDVFNGDIGRITSVDPDNQVVIVTFDGFQVPYDFSDLDEISLAYAISVHKSQGSEYPAVIIPILFQHYVLLQRNLIYTGITRGKRLVVIVGSKKALAIGIRNDKIMRRYTYLSERIKNS